MEEQGESTMTGILAWQTRRAKRWVLGPALGLCVSLTGLAVVPSAASACASLARVKSFHGTAQFMNFSETASGQDAGGGGNTTIDLERDAQSLKVNLTRNTLLSRSGIIAFTGTASGGQVSVKDSYKDTGSGHSGAEDFSGPLKNKSPNSGKAWLYFDTRTCTYQAEAGFTVKATFTGDETVRPSASVTGLAYGDKRHTPASLKLQGAESPHAYYPSCPRASILAGHSCYVLSGGWAGDFAVLAQCQSAGGGCGLNDQQSVGNATFAWALSPTYKKS
jgi:hypothetical protein